jgi:CDGSH-type Zn-finger protein
MGFQNAPYLKDETPRKVAWCACGQSENQPYCDGSHSRKNTGMAPVVVEITEEKKVAWCGCRRSGKKPFCDGSHSRP